MGWGWAGLCWGGVGWAGLDWVGAPASGSHAWASQATGRQVRNPAAADPPCAARPAEWLTNALPCALLSTSTGPARVHPTQLPLPECGVWHRRRQVPAAALIWFIRLGWFGWLARMHASACTRCRSTPPSTARMARLPSACPAQAHCSTCAPTSWCRLCARHRRRGQLRQEPGALRHDWWVSDGIRASLLATRWHNYCGWSAAAFF